MDVPKAKIGMLLTVVAALAAIACGAEMLPNPTGPTPDQFDGPRPRAPLPPLVLADVIDVSVTGVPGDHSLSVTVASPDIGCEFYTDWWEVVSEDGELLARRVLLHARVEEQPFTRSVGGLRVQPDDTVIIRAHMNVGGYGGFVMRGTVEDGFLPNHLPAAFAKDPEPIAERLRFLKA